MTNELTPRQLTRRKNLIHSVRVHAAGMHADLRALHDEKLYLSSHNTWEDFCRDEFGMSARNAQRILEYDRILGLLSHDEIGPMGPTEVAETQGKRNFGPAEVLSERHTREVAGLPDPEKKAVLEQAIETAPKDDSGKPKVTAEHVRQTRDSQPSKNGKSKAKGKGKSKPKNPFKELEKTIGTVSRALLAAGKVHGETDQYTTIFEAITTIKAAIEEWQAA